MTTTTQSDQSDESTDQPTSKEDVASREKVMRLAEQITKERHELFKRLADS